jgi:hypothetical protein
LLAGVIERKSYGALLSTFDGQVAGGLRVVVDGCMVPTLDASTIDMFIHAIQHAASPGCAVLTHDFRGAASRVAADATAFGLRHDHVLIEVIAFFPANSDALAEDRHRSWARRSREAFARALPGGYPNLLGRDDLVRAAVSYGANADRLIRAKRRFDPDNVFSSAIPLPRFVG